MDSGNSGSLQSSSGGVAGGDEDFDSKTESISSFLNHHSSHFNPNPNSILQTLNTTFFDHSSASYFPPSNIGRPDSSYTGFGATQNDDVYLNSQQTMFPNNESPPVSSNANTGVAMPMKNIKKRTRASRRAPTTVLNTDNTNFRQMVQEFTGIPNPTFSAATSRRLDLFGLGIGRPSPQKLQLQQPFVTSLDASSSNYSLLPSGIQGFQKQPQTLFTSQNPLFSFQSHIQKLPQQVNANSLGTTKSDDRQSDLQSGFSSSSTKWMGENENLVNFHGENGNTTKGDEYKLNSLSFDHQTEKGLENVITSRNGVDQAQGNVDSWLCPSD